MKTTDQTKSRIKMFTSYSHAMLQLLKTVHFYGTIIIYYAITASYSNRPFTFW